MGIQDEDIIDVLDMIGEDESFVEESVDGKEDEWDSSDGSSEGSSNPPDILDCYDTFGAVVDPEKIKLDDRATILKLQAALAESEKKNMETAEVTQYYEDKLNKLHHSQTYAIERMGKRIDLLEEELMKRSMQVETSQVELKRAVERIVLLQEELANVRTTNPTSTSPRGDILGVFRPRRRANENTSTKEPGEEQPAEDTDTDEDEFEGREGKEEENQSGDQTLDEGSMNNENPSAVPPRRFQIGRIFSFGQRKQNQSMLDKTSELSNRPSAIEEFYESAELPEVSPLDEPLLTAEEKVVYA